MSRWFRFYSEALDDPKVQMLTPELFKAWVNLLCFAAKNDGVIVTLPETLHETAFALRETEEAFQAIISDLVKRGLIDKVGRHYEPHNWRKRQYKSDTSSERVSRYRERQRNVSCNVSETPPDTDTDTDKKDNKNGNGLSKKTGRVYAFEHGVVRLLESDLAKWRKAFPHVSVEGELIAKEPWLAKQASWFNAAAGWLAKAEKQATARPPPERHREKDPLGNWVETGRELDPFGNEVRNV